jgi:hypothetical protein
MGKDGQQSIAPQRLAKDSPSRNISPARLDDARGQIEPEQGDPRHHCFPLLIAAGLPWRTNAVGGWSYHRNLGEQPVDGFAVN